MKFVFALLSVLFISNNLFAQAQTFPMGSVPGAQLVVSPAVSQAEMALATQEGEYTESLYDLEAEIASLQGYQQDLDRKIPEVREARSKYRKNDGCFNALLKDTKEICYGPFSDEPTTRENYTKGLQLSQELGDLKLKSTAVSKRLRELEARAKPLRKQKAKVAQMQADEESRIKKAIDKTASAETADRAAEIRKEEEMRRAQDLLNERQEKRHSTEISDLRSQIKKRDVQSALSDLKLQQSQAAEALRIIEEEYDKSLMGAYMQKKIAALLESDLLCKKTAECQSGKKTKVSQEEILKLFPIAPAAPKTSSSSSNSGSR